MHFKGGSNLKQPSDEALKNLLRFLLKTSVPRILKEQEDKKKEESASV